VPPDTQQQVKFRLGHGIDFLMCGSSKPELGGEFDFARLKIAQVQISADLGRPPRGRGSGFSVVDRHTPTENGRLSRTAILLGRFPLGATFQNELTPRFKSLCPFECLKFGVFEDQNELLHYVRVWKRASESPIYP
jgi:hypothetical protein